MYLSAHRKVADHVISAVLRFAPRQTNFFVWCPTDMGYCWSIESFQSTVEAMIADQDLADKMIE